VSHREQGEARRHELEQRLLAAQRLDAIGRLAGGVAQDFNGLLASISSHAAALQQGLGEMPALRAEADAIVRAAARGNALTGQLELFSHRAAEAGPGFGNGERILLVEDEESLRVMMRRMLLSHGYDVFDAANAEEGLRAVEGQAIDLLLTDVDLPRVDGPDLARKLLSAQPALRVLYIGEPAADRAGRAAAPVIRKPFTPVALLTEVRRALGAGE
jgi:CheY-like chemotaxis protein